MLPSLCAVPQREGRCGDWRPRRDLAGQLMQLLQAATEAGPQHAHMVASCAVGLCGDPVWAVRQAAAEQVGRALAAGVMAAPPPAALQRGAREDEGCGDGGGVEGSGERVGCTTGARGSGGERGLGEEEREWLEGVVREAGEAGEEGAAGGVLARWLLETAGQGGRGALLVAACRVGLGWVQGPAGPAAGA